MNIAICGTRGIPACYGGFETFAEELSARLVQRGHKVRVYGRKHVIDYAHAEYKGVEICLHWAPKHKYLETPVGSLLSFFHLLRKPADVVLVCNGANSPFIWILRLRGMPVLVNVDGIERLRGKWNLAGRLWYRLGEICSVLFSSRIIADASVIHRYYKDFYRTDAAVIPYGFRELPQMDELIEAKLSGNDERLLQAEGKEVFAELGLTANKYFLYVSRLEPENNAHVVLKAYAMLSEGQRRSMPLVVVGDAPYAADYISQLNSLATPEVIFAGYRFDAQYTALQLAAFAYVQATEVGGTHPALVESMGFGNAIVANDTPENREVLSSAGIFYKKNDAQDLHDQLLALLRDNSLKNSLQNKALEHARRRFKWDVITNNYVDLLGSFCRSRKA